MKENELSKRLFDFAVRVLKYLPKLPKTLEFKTIRYQISKCSSSSGANYEEAQAGSSRADFLNKIRISLKEIRESNYWLRLTFAVLPSNFDHRELKFLVQESNELKNILGAIQNKVRKSVRIKDKV